MATVCCDSVIIMSEKQKAVLVNLMTLSAGQLAQLLLGLTSLCWAIALVHHPVTHPALAILLEILSPTCWAIVFSMIAAFEFGTLLRIIRPCQCAAALRGVLAVLWVFIAISLLLSNIIAAGDVTVSLLAIWLFMRQAVRDECDGGKH